MRACKLIVDRACEHEAARAEKGFLALPYGGRLINSAWREMRDRSRRKAAHRKRFGVAPGEPSAMLAKSGAHFLMLDLAVWITCFTWLNKNLNTS